MTGLAAGMDRPVRLACARSITAGLGAAAIAMALAAPAVAAQPTHQGCLGHDVSAYAEAGAGLGVFIAGLAADGGVGEEIQAHLAGDIPDTVIPNSCSD